MVYLPDEIVEEEVLSRLPVKSLLCFRCVSKPWLALISSPYFVKLHLNRSVQTKRNLSLFLSHLFRVDFDSFEDDGIVLQQVEIDYFTSWYPHHKISICGSCDGLLCMTIECFLDNVFIWNPSTKQSIIPPSASTVGQYYFKIITSWVYRFGYDNTNNDYKVVQLMFFKVEKNIEYEIMIYSLKSNSWHKPNKFPYLPKLWSIGDSITCGAMHWISNMGSDSEIKNVIVAFDLGTEKYRVIPQPELSGSHFYLYLSNFEGCLSASCRSRSSSVDIFLLKEYGGKNEHWSKLITISQTLSTRRFFDTLLKPIAYSRCGKKILFQMDYKRLVWYNLEQKSNEEIRVHVMEDFGEVYTCMESMVSLDVPEIIRVNQI